MPSAFWSIEEAIEWRKRYEAVLRSARWKNMRNDLAKISDGCCERCRKKPWRLELHHVNYKNLGNERRADVQLLCADCHKIADREREEYQARKSQQRQENAAFDTYCRKKFGEDHMPDESDWNDFQDWRERKSQW